MASPLSKKAVSPSTTAPEISVLVPVMNECGNIRPLIDEICDALKGRHFEIIYIDDASTDDGPAELAIAAAELSLIHI